MGPVLKFLFGLFLVVWILLGMLLLGGGVFAGIALNHILTSSPDNKSGNQATTSSVGGLSPQAIACVTKELGLQRVQQLTTGKAQINAQDRAAMDKCGIPADENP